MTRPINGYPNYTIDDTGNVVSSRGKMKPWISDRGYYYVRLSRNNKANSFRLHRLVAEHYMTNWDSNSEINHIDGDKSNNCITNLEISSRTENCRHAALNGFSKFKLSIAAIHLIRSSVLKQKDLAKIFDVDVNHISRIKRKIRWGWL